MVEIFRAALARVGIGGYYRYTYDFWHPDNPPKIIGPFDNRAEAEGMLRYHGRHYTPLCIEVKYHREPIEGAEPNIKIE